MNTEELLAKTKDIAEKYNVPANTILQNFMLERLLERISQSSYQNKFILKGGFLISAMVGLPSRTTMDMDATIKGMTLTEENIIAAFTGILSEDISDGVIFTLA